jgi:excisionase family DNA binding protein
MSTISADDIMTARQVAEFLGVTRRRVSQLARAGKLPALMQIDRSVSLFLRADVEALYQRRNRTQLETAMNTASAGT